MTKGFGEIIIILAIAFLGLASLPVVANINEQNTSPSPIETTEPSATPVASPLPHETTLPENGKLDIHDGNSQVHVENKGNTTSVHVETSGNGSASVNVKSNTKSEQTVTTSNTSTVTWSSN